MRPSPHPLAGLLLLAPALAGCTDATAPREARQQCDRVPEAVVTAPDVRLYIGTATILPEEAQLCLVLPDPNQRYLLAYVDTRPIEWSREEPEIWMEAFGIRVRDLAAGAAWNALAAEAPGRAQDPFAALYGAGHLVSVSGPATSTHPASRPGPWREDETFVLWDDLRGADRTARVHRVYDSWLVVAAFEDEPTPRLGVTLEMLDAAWPDLLSIGLPLLRSAFGTDLPVTSNGSGQLLLLVRPDLQQAVGVSYGTIRGTKVFSWLAITPNAVDSRRTPYSLGSLVLHEIAHAFQREYLNETRPAGEDASASAGRTFWGVEGGALLLERELARRQAGISLTANYDWLNPGAREVERWYALYATRSNEFTRGYQGSAPFLAQLVSRLVATGETVDAAVAEVSRGAVEGWYGHVHPGRAPRRGMTARMQARLGSGWNPADALLTWTLSHALDDRSSNPLFQDPAFLELGRIPPGGWPDGWGGAPHGTLTAGEGGTVEMLRRYGSVGYFELGGGGAFHLFGEPGIRWAVARAR
jgi:hypothetical protein